MAGRLVPLHVSDWLFFDRQRDLFKNWIQEFDDDFKMDFNFPTFEDQFKKFDLELEIMKKEMFRLDSGDSILKVDNPFVMDAKGNKKLALRFDVHDYKPHEISVKTVDNKLMVHATHTEESPEEKIYKEFTKEYALPNKIDTLGLTSILSKDGVLSIEAPAPAEVEARREYFIPIEKL
ncbi:hypothetical protein CHS0354_020118 [Potamilus streckersoni]|uniref:SHSP domain-containing protein n=1 Tax=Potamilus streckersoni TaxID=2493646 RepID=A0AAE0VPP8_9BIVA|nr:hypothetical protein CHS0354_020118 [Potamilus streckersoni]